MSPEEHKLEAMMHLGAASALGEEALTLLPAYGEQPGLAAAANMFHGAAKAVDDAARHLRFAKSEDGDGQ